MPKTDLCDLLQTDYPLIQGGMAWVANACLASAVSNAGALGLVAAGSMNADLLRREIRLTREQTDRPFGVNIMLMNPDVDALAAVVLEERVPVVTTGAGSPGKYIQAWKDAGIRVVPVVASVAYAKRMEKLGADAVIAEGTEAGGHIGELTTWS
jgi:enoyl-[acyl-carrier protein] reductase II